MKILIIVPAYNEALNIVGVIKDITENTDYDYVIVNDASTDGTKKICEEKNYNVLTLPTNLGLTSGIQLGMKYAYKNNYDIAIQFDGDGQHEAKYLPQLVKAIEEGECEIAIGSRFVNKNKPHTIRMIGSNMISRCIKFTTGKTIKDPTSGMRAYDKEIIKKFATDSSVTPEPDTIAYLIKKGVKIKEIQVEMKERKHGKSYLTIGKAMKYMISILFSILFVKKFQK